MKINKLPMLLFVFGSHFIAHATNSQEESKEQPNPADQQADNDPFTFTDFQIFQPNGRSVSRVDIYKQTAKGIDDFAKFAELRYGPIYGNKLITALNGIGESFLPLAADPGLALRVEDFADFVRKQKLEKDDPWSVRENYSTSLGTEIVYRGLALKPELFEEIRKIGIKSAALRHVPPLQSLSTDSLAMEMLARLNIVSIRERVGDPLTSVTTQIKTGVCVAGGGVELPDDFDKSQLPTVYVFRINMPKIDIINLDDKSELCEYPERKNEELSYFKGEPADIRPLLCKHLLYPSNIESFVPLIIGPEEITHVKSYQMGDKTLVAACDNTKMLRNSECHRLLPLKALLPAAHIQRLAEECVPERGYQPNPL